jgi:SAM-dependent methyltransferase
VAALAGPAPRAAAALQAEILRVARHVVESPARLRALERSCSLKQVLPQVRAITRGDYRRLYPPRGMYLTAKADGKRAVALARDGQAWIVADRLLEFGAERRGAREGETVVDGELVEAEGGAVFHAFDVIAVAGESVTGDGFERRLDRLAEAVGRLRAAGAPARAKSFARLAGETPAELEREIRGVLEAPQDFAADGLILVEPGRPYAETGSFKWKDRAHTTLDCVARRAPPSALGAPPFADRPGHRLHFLFVTIEEGLYAALGLQPCPGYAELFGLAAPAAARRPAQGGPARPPRRGSGSFPIQFAPCDAPLAYLYQHPDASPFGEVDGRVLEVRCAGACAAAGGGAPLADWELVQLRSDRQADLATGRYFGNHFQVAETTWLNYVDPFPAEQLWTGPSDDYFMRPKAAPYGAQTAALSFVKDLRIAAELRGAAWVVDLGAGKGQDLHRFRAAGVRRLVVVDKSRAALAELVRRNYELARARTPAPAGAHRTTLHALAADATQPAAALLERLRALGVPAAGADALVCNLAVHYFLGATEGLRNFAELAHGAVRPGGRLILTILRGDAVHAAFVAAGLEPGQAWEARENGALKYSLQRRYVGAELEAAGQMIGVLLPFSDGRHYEEPLVNPRELTRELKLRGFRLQAETKATEALAAFERQRPAKARALTTADREYLGFYGELVYVREAPTGGQGLAGSAGAEPGAGRGRGEPGPGAGRGAPGERRGGPRQPGPAPGPAGRARGAAAAARPAEKPAGAGRGAAGRGAAGRAPPAGNPAGAGRGATLERQAQTK